MIVSLPEFSRTAGKPLVLPIGLGNSAQVLVRACARSSRRNKRLRQRH